jgi:molecular chaperone DnaK (HSP70)
MRNSRYSPLLPVVLVILHLGCQSAVSTITVEDHTMALREGMLVEDIGIETLGGVFTPLLGSGRTVPCEDTEKISTAADDADQMEVRLFRGKGEMTKDATFLGRFLIDGLPRRPRGKVIVAVTFAVSVEGSITITAREQSGHAVRLRRDDG